MFFATSELNIGISWEGIEIFLGFPGVAGKGKEMGRYVRFGKN